MEPLPALSKGEIRPVVPPGDEAVERHRYVRDHSARHRIRLLSFDADTLAAHHGGAEIECTFLFADVRGSTTLAEGMRSADFRGLLDRFYDTAAAVVFDHDGFVDKFVGDELVAFFFPLLTGTRHAARGVEAARALLLATGHADVAGPWVPVGAVCTLASRGSGPSAREHALS
jgi:class 3 adenylate cyclase